MKKPKQKFRRGSIKVIIISITTIPLLIACVIITFFASWTLQKGLQSQIFIGLKSAASGALLSLDNISSESFHVVDDDLYKGDFNLTQNMESIDYYAESNDVVITFFYGDTRMATTILDQDGNRIVGTKASTEVYEAVQKQGEEYHSTKVDIEGTNYFGYYMPVSDLESGEIIGMVFAGRERDEINSYIWKRINFVIVLSAIIYAACFAISLSIANKKFLTPIKKLSDVAQELASGNIDQTITKDADNEFGDLTDAFSDLMNNIANQALVADKMAGGDLTVNYTPAGSQDVMGNAIKKMVEDNNRSLALISGATARMVAGVNEISSASNALAQGTTEQASAIEEITASIHGIAETAKVNAKDAGGANELVKSTEEEAIHSNEQMNQLIAAMQNINNASENISKIMKIIDSIASQTNIIALNASVEAARAGVYGKGFAVVADEVRALAAKSAEAAKNSAEMIEDSITKVKIGTDLATETAASLEQIRFSVEKMATLVNRIAEASENQSSSVSQVNTGISQISDVVQTNSATAQECAATSSELSNLADELRGAVAKYKLSIEDI